jgi:DNA-binding response OmpR family regulator
MVALKQNVVALPDIAASSPLSWEYVKDAYCSYFMSDPMVTACLVIYIIITLFIIVFLLQPKAARTWTRTSRHTGRRDEDAASDGTTEIADLHCSPIVATRDDSPPHTTDTAHRAAQSHLMPQLPRKSDNIVLHPSAMAHGSAAILYVTDTDASDHLIDSLGAAGLAVISCPPGKDAVRQVAVTKYDLVVIDTLVAEAARLCATRLLEALPAKPVMPVLIVAASPGQTLNLAATNARIDYIFKPFDDNFMVAKVNLMIAQRNSSKHGGSDATRAPSLPYDKHMEQLVESLPTVVDDIHHKSQQQSLSNMELHSGVITTLGEDAAQTLHADLNSAEPLSDEIKKTADKVDELLRLCATVKPPKPQK